MVGIEWTPPDGLDFDEHELSKLEIDMPCDIHEMELKKATFAPQTYDRLSANQRGRIEKELSRDDESDFANVRKLMLLWKNPEEYDSEAAQSYELLAKKSLGISTNPREDGVDATTPTVHQINTFQQLYLISQCFLEVHYGSPDEPATKEVFRGIRKKSIAEITAQMIDNPESTECFFHTSTLSNHTGLEGVAFHHAESVVVHWRAPRKVVALACDRICNTPAQEDELQIVGGTIHVPARSVIHQGKYSGETRRLQTLIQGMDEPDSLSDDDHQDIADLVHMMHDKKYQLQVLKELGGLETGCMR